MILDKICVMAKEGRNLFDKETIKQGREWSKTISAEFSLFRSGTGGIGCYPIDKMKRFITKKG